MTVDPNKEYKDVRKKQVLWNWCIERGWLPIGRHNMLLHKGGMLRLNFRDDKILKLEKRIRLTEDQKMELGKVNDWKVLEEAEYMKVETGKVDLVFEKKKDKTDATVKKGE